MKFLFWVIGIVAALLLIVVTILYFEIRLVPKDGKELADQEMIVYFNDNFKSFNSLNYKIIKLKNKGLKRIDDLWTDPEKISEVGLSESELTDLRKEMNDLKIPRGVNCYGDGIKYFSYTYGLATGGITKGFYYSENEPKNYYKHSTNLQEKPYNNYKNKILPEYGSYAIYVKITDSWYIFEEYDD